MLDLSRDYLVFDDPETVTYGVKTGEGVFAAPAAVPYAYWEELSEKDYKMQPQLLQQHSRAVNLWTAQLAGIVPKLDDRVTDGAGVAWFVTLVQKLDLDGNGVQRYRLVCYRSA